MQNKIMPIVLICIGVVCIVIGVVSLYPKKQDASIKQNVAIETNTQSSDEVYGESHKNLSNKEKGNIFEGFVADCFKNREFFRVQEWNQGTTSPTGVYSETDKNPDFHIWQVFNNKFSVEYYIEAKYFSAPVRNNCIKIKDYQLKRYRQHQKTTHRKVLLAIGVGGNPDNPDNFYLVPIDSVRNEYIDLNTIKGFSLQDPHKTFGYRMKDYFQQEVFAKKESEGVSFRP